MVLSCFCGGAGFVAGVWTGGWGRLEFGLVLVAGWVGVVGGVQYGGDDTSVIIIIFAISLNEIML